MKPPLLWSPVLPALLATLFAGPCASAATYYVSAKGSDANSGTKPGAPWATVAKASRSLRAADTVRLRRGDVFFGTFRPAVTGTAQAPIMVAAYGTGRKPTVTGFKTVSDWKPSPEHPGVYEAVLNPTPSGLLEMVRFNGNIQAKGRLPKAGRGWEQDPSKPGCATDSWFQIKSHVKNSQVVTTDAIPDVTGGEIVQKKYQWIIDRGRITAMSASGGQTTISYTDGSPYEAWDRHGFFVQNHVNCLTELGDWSYDEAAHKLSIYFGARRPESCSVQAACLDNLADLTDRSYVHFEGVAFAGSNGDMIKLGVQSAQNGGSGHVSLNDCELSFAGKNGIGVTADSKDYSYTRTCGFGAITNCTVSDVNNDAVNLEENPGWSIVANAIQRVAMHEGLQQNSDGQGIAIYRTGDHSLVQYNEISYVGYTGIYFHGDGTQIRNNHVHHFCMVKSDGGGIYTYGGGSAKERKTWSEPRIVDGNIVHDGIGAHEGVYSDQPSNPYVAQAQGLYMDGNTTDVILTNNTVFRVASNGLLTGSNARITAHHNTLADNHTAQLAIDDQAGQPENLHIHHNLCVAFEAEQLCLSVGLAHPRQGQAPAEYVLAIGTLAENVYARPIEQPDNVATRGYPNAGGSSREFDRRKSYRDYGGFRDYTGGGVVSISWTGQFLSLDSWRSNWRQDRGTTKLPWTVSTIDDLRIEVNPARRKVTRTLPGTFEDAQGAVYVNHISLLPYSSAVLVKLHEAESARLNP